MKEINFGVMGADRLRRGFMAEYVHKPEEGLRVIAGATLHLEKKAESLREKYGKDIFLTEDYREMLKVPGLDAVIVCTPDHLHEEHAIAAMNAGKHVYLEKPMAISVESCDRIMDAATHNGVKLYIGHNMRFFPVMQKMKELIDSGKIGQVQSVWCRHFISYGGDAYFRDWHSEREYGHGLLLQKGAHDIDIIHWLAGGYTTRVVGMGQLSVYDKLPRRAPGDPLPSVEANRDNWPPKSTGDYSQKIDVEDSSMILMQLSNGVQASYLQSHYTPDDVRNYTVIGTEGRIENYGDTSADGVPHVHLWNKRTGYSEKGHEVFPVPTATDSHGGADPVIMNNFVNFLRGKPPAGATLLDARMSVAAGYFGTESIRNGNQPYDVPPYVAK
ncbi:MAG: Gfo/Idh/MocA family oxidoreductase [Chthoniobacterales bacterium]